MIYFPPKEIVWRTNQILVTFKAAELNCKRLNKIHILSQTEFLKTYLYFVVKQTPEDGERTNAACGHQTHPADLHFHGCLNSSVVLRHDLLYLYMFRYRPARQHLTL